MAILYWFMWRIEKSYHRCIRVSTCTSPFSYDPLPHTLLRSKNNQFLPCFCQLPCGWLGESNLYSNDCYSSDYGTGYCQCICFHKYSKKQLRLCIYFPYLADPAKPGSALTTHLSSFTLIPQNLIFKNLI